MEGFRHVLPIAVRFRDIDALGHVNNAVFFTYLETARVEYMHQVALQTRVRDFREARLILAEISCQFKLPIFYGQAVQVGTRVVKMGNSSFSIEQRIEADGQLAALSKSAVVHYDYHVGKSAPIPDELRARVEAFELGIREVERWDKLS
jgi:acyl-CoA thioester hydrolase